MDPGKSPLFTFSQSCCGVASRVTSSMQAAGVNVVENFNLCSSQTGLKNKLCPSMQSCSESQVIILHLHHPGFNPATLVLQESMGTTAVFLQLVEQEEGVLDEILIGRLIQAFFPEKFH